MSAYWGNFLIRKTGLYKSAHGLMTQVMEAKVLQTLLTLDRLPHAIKLVRPPFTIATRFTKKDQIRIFGSRRIAHGCAEKLNSLYAQWDGSWLGIFRLKQTDDS